MLWNDEQDLRPGKRGQSVLQWHVVVPTRQDRDACCAAADGDLPFPAGKVAPDSGESLSPAGVAEAPVGDAMSLSEDERRTLREMESALRASGPISSSTRDIWTWS